MAARRFYATTITMTVLSEEVPVDQMSLSKLAWETDRGGLVLHNREATHREVGATEMSRLLEEAGSDPSFFELDEERTMTYPLKLDDGTFVPSPDCMPIAIGLGLVTLIEEDDDGELLDQPHYEVCEEVLVGHDRSVGADEVAELVRLIKGPVAKVRTFVKGPPMTDDEALDALAYILSAPEWSVSFLEDIACVVSQTGRSTDIPGAQWGSH